MLRKKKKYLKPRTLYQAGRIKEENALVKKYGLRNKREIWKTLSKVNYYRHRAKELARESLEEQQIFFNKLKALGLKAETTSDVLDLKIEDLLERRLPTIVVKKGIAKTPLEARQLVIHKKILINGKVLNAPSYLVPIAEESAISLRKKEKKAKPVEAAPEQTEESEAQMEEAQ